MAYRVINTQVYSLILCNLNCSNYNNYVNILDNGTIFEAGYVLGNLPEKKQNLILEEVLGRKISAVFIIVEDKNTGKILQTQEPTKKKGYTIKNTLPGGKNHNGESPIECALREATEEVGGSTANQIANEMKRGNVDLVGIYKQVHMNTRIMHQDDGAKYFYPNPSRTIILKVNGDFNADCNQTLVGTEPGLFSHRISPLNFGKKQSVEYEHGKVYTVSSHQKTIKKLYK